MNCSLVSDLTFEGYSQIIVKMFPFHNLCITGNNNNYVMFHTYMIHILD